MERRWRQGVGHGGVFFVLPFSQDFRAFGAGEPVPDLASVTTRHYF